MPIPTWTVGQVLTARPHDRPHDCTDDRRHHGYRNHRTSNAGNSGDRVPELPPRVGLTHRTDSSSRSVRAITGLWLRGVGGVAFHHWLANGACSHGHVPDLPHAIYGIVLMIARDWPSNRPWPQSAWPPDGLRHPDAFCRIAAPCHGSARDFPRDGAAHIRGASQDL